MLLERSFFTDLAVVNPGTVAELMPQRKRIPDDVFMEVLRWLPIMTADFVVTRIGPAGKKEFLLGYRAEEPFQNTWFVPGGRLNWGETVLEACKRHLKRELDLEDTNPRLVGQVSVMNPESKTRPLWHSIWNLHEVPVGAETVIKPNAENAEVRWFTHIDPAFPEPVREGLRLLGFHEA